MPALPPQGVAALRLKNANPEAFDMYVAQLEQYERTLMDELVRSPQHEILAAQGRVQVLQVLIRTLKECHLPRTPQKPATP